MKAILIIRNPYNHISASYRGWKRKKRASQKGMLDLVESYFGVVDAVNECIETLQVKSYTLKLEDLILDTERVLKEVCFFLGIEDTDLWLKRCVEAEFLFSSPRITTGTFPYWTDENKEIVRKRMLNYPQFEGYVFEEDKS